MNKIDLLIIIDYIDNGGVSNVLITLLNHINRNHFNIELLTFSELPEYEKLVPDGIPIRHVYKKNPAKHNHAMIRFIYGIIRELIPGWLIRKFIIKKQYDIVIDFKGNNLNVVRAARARKIFWSHKDFSLESNPIERAVEASYGKTWRGRFKRNAFLKSMKQCDDIVCITQKTKESFAERFGYRDKITVLYNLIDSRSIQKKASEPISYNRLDGFLFCCLSRISDGKGIERLFRCVKRLNAQGFQFHLLLVGGGDTYEKMVSLKQDLQLENVEMVGHQNNPYPYLASADAFVCPSETECFPCVLCEAVVLKKPVIMTNVGAVEEILGNSEYGYIVKNDEDAIYKGMKLFLEHPEALAQYAEKVKRRESFFDMNHNIAEIEEFLLYGRDKTKAVELQRNYQ